MIIENNEILLPYDEYSHLGRMSELENFDQLITRIKFEMKKRGYKEASFYNEEAFQKKFGRRKTNRSKYHSGINSALNYRVTNHNPHLMRDKELDLVRRQLGINTSGAKENALILTSYAYEFFFIHLPKRELETEQLTNERINSIQDCTSSFWQLKKAFTLLEAPVALGMGVVDNGIEKFSLIGKHTRKDYGHECYEEYKKVLESEGFRETGRYNQFPLLSTVFVQLFAPLATNLISSNKYKLNRIEVRGKEKRQGYRGIMDFYLRDFMPKVISRIESLLKEKPSNIGWELYRSISGIKDYLVAEKRDSAEKSLRKITRYLQQEGPDWDRWAARVQEDATEFNTWAQALKSKDEYDPMSLNKSAEELYNDTFDDRRNVRKHDDFSLA